MFGNLFGSAKNRAIIDPIEIKETSSGISNPENWFLDLIGGQHGSSGISVTSHNAMDCAAVSCAVKAITETIGQLPIHVLKRGPDGSKERAPNHPTYRLVHDDVTEWCSAGEFQEQLTEDALLFEQGGFAFINRVNGRPVELNRLDPEAVQVDRDKVTGEPIYKVTFVNSRQQIFGFRDIFHIRGRRSPVKQAREAIGLAMVMERHAGRLFGNGARPGGLLNLQGQISPEGLEKAKATFQAAHGGNNSGKTAVMNNAEFKPITLTSVDAQFAELRKFAIAEIARAFRVPPTLLMDFDRATHSNSEAMGQQFLTYSLEPWLKRWEAEIRLKLFTPEERDTYIAEFLTDDLLRSDFEKRARSYTLAISSRWLSPNEVRAMENRPPYEGGDVYENPNTTAAPALLADATAEKDSADV